MNGFAALVLIWAFVLAFVAYMVTTTGNGNWAWLIVLPAVRHERKGE